MIEINDPEYEDCVPPSPLPIPPLPANAYRMPRPEQIRGATHGDYAKMAATIQRIKTVMRDGHSWPLLTPGQQEALELIATKIGRIVEGDPNHHDHWADLSGYATKGLESCR